MKIAGPYPALVITCDLDSTLEADEATAVLSPDEIVRADRYVFERDRRRFICGRAFLRGELGQALAMSPSRVPIRTTATGKPFVPGAALQFNLSHCGSLAVLALSDQAAIGIDVEMAELRGGLADDLPLLSLRVLRPEEVAVLEHVPVEQLLCTFLAFWTAKEAHMKLTGHGLRTDPRDIALKLQCALPTGYLEPNEPNARLWSVPIPGNSAICHLATSEGPLP